MAKTVSDILIKFKEAGTGDVANAFNELKVSFNHSSGFFIFMFIGP